MNFGILIGKVSALVRANFGHKLVILLILIVGGILIDFKK
jgi:hypothetical protein